jgi:hypothetical protein
VLGRGFIRSLPNTKGLEVSNVKKELIELGILKTFFFVLVVMLSERADGLSLIVSTLTYYAIWAVWFFGISVSAVFLIDLIVSLALILLGINFDQEAFAKKLANISISLSQILFIAIVYPWFSGVINVLVDLGWQQLLMIETLVIVSLVLAGIIQKSQTQEA